MHRQVIERNVMNRVVDCFEENKRLREELSDTIMRLKQLEEEYGVGHEMKSSGEIYDAFADENTRLIAESQKNCCCVMM